MNHVKWIWLKSDAQIVALQKRLNALDAQNERNHFFWEAHTIGTVKQILPHNWKRVMDSLFKEGMLIVGLTRMESGLHISLMLWICISVKALGVIFFFHLAFHSLLSTEGEKIMGYLHQGSGRTSHHKRLNSWRYTCLPKCLVPSYAFMPIHFVRFICGR